MGNKYNEQDINRFFENFKNLKNTYDLEKVHHLINTPAAKATQKVKFNHKPLKFIIMTSILMILVSAVLFWPEAEVNNRNGEIETTISILERDREQSFNVDEVNPPQPNKLDSEEKKELRKAKREEVIAPMPKENKTEKDPTEEMVENPKVLVEDSIQTCEWPADTVIDKTTLLVKLNVEELERLGIIVDNENLYYYNEVPKESQSSVNISSTNTIIGNIPEEKKIITKNKFASLFMSSEDYQPTMYKAQELFSSMDTLVPVLVTSEYFSFIFWFNAHADLFNELPERYGYLRDVYSNLICLKREYPIKSFVDYPFASVKDIGDAITYLDLNKKELEKIGINMLQDCMVIQAKDLEQTYSSWYNKNQKTPNENNWIDSLDIVRISEESFPIVATDTLGRLYDYYTNIIYNKHNLSEIKDLLIPVKIDSKKYYEKSIFEEWLWWFYPTDEFVNALPERIKHELKLERDAIINNTPNQSGSCNYFEACKSTLWLDDLSIYPNPANETVRIDFSLDEAIEGRISLVNISGSLVKVIVPQTTLQSGLNSYEAKLSDVSPGIYLVSIVTENGFKTQRIIVSR